MNARFGLLAIPVAALAVACSGGGSSPQPGATPGGNGSGVVPKITQTLTLSVAVPAPATKSSSHRRRPSDNVYVSPGTASIVVQLVAVDGTSVAGTGITQPAPVMVGRCAAGCAVSVPGVPAAVGVDTYSVSTYAAPTATGSTPLISEGVVAIVVGTNGPQSTALNDPTKLAVGGLVASLAPPIVTPPFIIGVPSTSGVIVNALDAAGYTIVDAEFVTPITVALPSGESSFALAGVGLQPNGTVSLTRSEGVAAGGGPAISLISTGTGTQTTITASAVDQNNNPISASTTVTAGTPSPSPSPSPTPGVLVASVTALTFTSPAVPPQTFTVSQSNFAGPFTVANSNSAAVTASISGSTVTVTPVGFGSSAIVVSGANGQTVTVGAAVGDFVAVPSSLAFVHTGIMQAVTIRQANFAGPFTVAVIDPATGQPSTGVVTATISGTQVAVTSVNAGAANVVVTGGFGRTLIIPAGVTLTPGTIQ